VQGKPAALDGPRLVVGDLEIYEARCEHCWLEERLILSA
jgi:thymidine kinase